MLNVDWIFWLSMALMIVGFVIPGVGIIGAQILMLR